MLDNENERGAGDAYTKENINIDYEEDDFSYYPAEDGETADMPEADTETVTAGENTAVTENNDDDGDDFDLGTNHAGRRKTRAKRVSKAGKIWKKIRLPLIGALAVILCAILGFFGYALTTIKEDRIMNNVYIENINVSGMTYDEALNAINSSKMFENSEITLTDGKTEFVINGEEIGLAALPEETAQKAVDYCKQGNIFVKAFRAGKLIFTPHTIVPVPKLDEEKFGQKLDECGNLMAGERKEHYVEFDGEQSATVYSGQTGYDGDHSAAHDQVVNAMINEKFRNIRVDFETSPPVDMTLEMLDAVIYKDPVDARYEINGNEVTVTADETGRYIDKSVVAQLVNNIYEGCEPVSIPYFVSEPETTAETLTAKLFANTLSTYSTSYSGSTWNRCQNVARAASLINGTVVAPGAVFSFNDTVGHRTTENGFYTAKEYVNGESVDGIGGGTCQVSSTLYSAVLYADMGIIERLNHMMSVGYIPLGQDATVADGGVDFRFRNTSDYPVKISASTDGSTITVRIIGTAWEPAREVKISNSSTAVGENTVVHSTRYVYSDGQLISTDTLNTSTYMPHKQTSSATETPRTDSDDSDDYDEESEE